MATVQWTLPGRQFLHWLWLMYSLTKITFVSLFYNDFADKYYVGDTLMEPMFWVVDHFTKALGPVCVLAVIFLSSSLITIAYVIGLPFYLQQNFYILCVALILGHWFLINNIFYYYMAFTTQPGCPPQGAMITEAVSICKKCIAPKPPRTHHCSVCNRCILKMDHHCPWLNNCIGHFNHRYFFMFCMYAWTGVIFVILFGIPVAYDHFFISEHNSISPVIVNFMKSVAKHIVLKSYLLQKENSHFNIPSNTTNVQKKWPETLYHSCIVYAALLCVAVLFVVGGLLVWHGRLIARGETSIEAHINKKERTRLLKEGKIYKNPYDFGCKKNFEIFLCIDNNRPWWYLLLPLAKDSIGDGLQWDIPSSINCNGVESQIPLSKSCFVKLSSSKIKCV